MKVAISVKEPGIGCQMDPRFGRAEHFLIVDTDNGQSEPFDNSQNAQASSGAGVKTGKSIVDLGVTVVITGHVGPKAMDVLKGGSVDIYTVANGTAQDALRQFEAGSLQAVE